MHTLRSARRCVLPFVATLATFACDHPPARPIGAGWSPALETLLRGRSAAVEREERCELGDPPGAVLDVLWARSHKGALRSDELDEWLERVAFKYFERCYERGAAELGRLPPHDSWHRAEAEYAGWLVGHSDKMLASVLNSRACVPTSKDCVPFAHRWPGFDELGAGLPVVQRWVGSGYQTDDSVDTVVCPRPLDYTIVDERCGWFRHAVLDPVATLRLAEIVGKADDPALVHAIIPNLRRLPAERIVEFWRALEPWPRTWREAGVTAADTLLEDPSVRELLLREAKRAYEASDRRDAALYVLARDWTWGHRGGHLVASWESFSLTFGGPIDLPLFGKLLDLSPRALDLVPIVWPALAKGGSRAQPVIDHLDGFLASPGPSMGTLHKIAGTVCHLGSRRELTELHDWLVQRRRQGSPYDTDVGGAAFSTVPGHCTAMM